MKIYKMQISTRCHKIQCTNVGIYYIKGDVIKTKKDGLICYSDFNKIIIDYFRQVIYVYFLNKRLKRKF